jgi:hypothetical protein
MRIWSKIGKDDEGARSILKDKGKKKNNRARDQQHIEDIV